LVGESPGRGRLSYLQRDQRIGKRKPFEGKMRSPKRKKHNPFPEETVDVKKKKGLYYYAGKKGEEENLRRRRSIVH